MSPLSTVQLPQAPAAIEAQESTRQKQPTPPVNTAHDASESPTALGEADFTINIPPLSEIHGPPPITPELAVRAFGPGVVRNAPPVPPLVGTCPEWLPTSPPVPVPAPVEPYKPASVPTPSAGAGWTPAMVTPPTEPTTVTTATVTPAIADTVPWSTRASKSPAPTPAAEPAPAAEAMNDMPRKSWPDHEAATTAAASQPTFGDRLQALAEAGDIDALIEHFLDPIRSSLMPQDFQLRLLASTIEQIGKQNVDALVGVVYTRAITFVANQYLRAEIRARQAVRKADHGNGGMRIQEIITPAMEAPEGLMRLFTELTASHARYEHVRRLTKRRHRTPRPGQLRLSTDEVAVPVAG